MQWLRRLVWIGDILCPKTNTILWWLQSLILLRKAAFHSVFIPLNFPSPQTLLTLYWYSFLFSFILILVSHCIQKGALSCPVCYEHCATSSCKSLTHFCVFHTKPYTYITPTWQGLLLWHEPEPLLQLDMLLDYLTSSRTFSYTSACISFIIYRDDLHLNLGGFIVFKVVKFFLWLKNCRQWLIEGTKNCKSVLGGSNPREALRVRREKGKGTGRVTIYTVTQRQPFLSFLLHLMWTPMIEHLGFISHRDLLAIDLKVYLIFLR